MTVRGIKIEGSEEAAFEKLIVSLRHGTEAAREIGLRRGDDGWGRIGIIFEQIEKNARELYAARKVRGIRL